MRSYADINLFNWPNANFMHVIGSVHNAHGCNCIPGQLWFVPKAGRGERLHSHRGMEKNPVNWSRICPKFGWYGKVNQKSGRFTNIPFHSCVNRKGRSSSGPLSGPVGFLQVHTSAFHLLSWLLSPSISEKLSFPGGVFIFRNKLLNFNFSKPQNSFL